MFSLYLRQHQQRLLTPRFAAFVRQGDIPFVIEGPDNESQGWANSIHVLIHEPLDNCSFPSIVQSSSTLLAVVCTIAGSKGSLQHQDPHLFILQTSFPEN